MEVGMMWLEADVAYFKVLSQYLFGGTEENYVNVKSEKTGPGAENWIRILRNTNQEC
jgi:hypothetical protein